MLGIDMHARFAFLMPETVHHLDALTSAISGQCMFATVQPRMTGRTCYDLPDLPVSVQPEQCFHGQMP